MKRLAQVLVLLALACSHAPAAPPPSSAAGGRAPPAKTAAPSADPVADARTLSTEAHALLRSEAQLLWTRWTTGAGPAASSALAEHPRLVESESGRLLAAAAAGTPAGPDRHALELLRVQVVRLAAAHAAESELTALERARAGLSFTLPAEPQAEHGERDLDRLLGDEPSAAKRAALAAAEARAAAQLAPLALARDAALAKALSAADAGFLGLEEAWLGVPPAELAALAERTLALTEETGRAAVEEASQHNLGLTPDRLRRADLARLSRATLADPQFPPGRALESATATLTALGLPLPPSVSIDALPSPAKGARPLALLVDPPADVRLSVGAAGGFEEQRAVLHEVARAGGGAFTTAPRWELSQLGAGSAAEGAAELFEELADEPGWLRDHTQLRGEPLDDLIHTQAARRLLRARRAAALVLFELQRRDAPATAAAQGALYRGLIQRATFATLTDEDAGRWTLESESWVQAAPALLGAVLAAQLERAWAHDGAPWWKNPAAGPALRALWQGGRSRSAVEAASAAGLGPLDPGALAAVVRARLAYAAPDPRPPAVKPDYKLLQGDKRRRRRRRH